MPPGLDARLRGMTGGSRGTKRYIRNIALCRAARIIVAWPPTARLAIIDDATIIVLVDAFYARVRRDPVLAPIFAASIDEAAWPAHLRRMYAFWSSVMLTSGRYKGNPVEVHQRVPGIAPALFVRWLDLFEATAMELFIPSLAEAFGGKARRIAESLRLALFFRPTEPWPTDLRQCPSVAAP